MQVQLKQTEIITALKQYISGQGISLQGKTVDMAFTAGRKESGITVEISIDDAGIPDFFNGVGEDTEQVPAASPLTLVKATAYIANDSTEKAAAPAEAITQATGDASEETAAPGGGDGNVVEADPVTLIPTGKSLFN